MAVEVFGNVPFTTVSSGGTDAPASGTQQTWTVASSAGFPAVSSSATPPTQLHVADVALNSEVISVISISGTTWTVIRGAESTTPVSHSAGFTVYQVVSAGGYTQLRSLDWLNVVTQFGADSTGAADSATAIQNAINALPAGGGTVYFPAGSYKTGTSLTPVSGLRLTSDSYSSANVFSTTASVINMSPGSLIDNLEIDHLTLQATGADLFTGARLVRPYIHDCQLIQNSAGFAIWNAPSVALLVEGRFERNTERVHGATRSVAAWYLAAPSNANNVNTCTWKDNVCFNADADATQYFYVIVANTAGTTNNEQNSFRGVVFENTLGGMIWVDSGSYTQVDNCLLWDATTTIAADLIKFTKNANGAVPVGNIVRQSGKTTGTLGAGVADISVDANCVVTLIENPAASVINLNGATKTTLLGLQSSASILNGPTVTGKDMVISAESAHAVQLIKNTTSAPAEPAAVIESAASGDSSLGCQVAGDTTPRLVVDSAGKHNWGSGSGAADTDLYRSSASVLTTDTAFKAQRLLASGITGATAVSRYVGAIASGTAPSSGTFNTGDVVIVLTGSVIICTAGGTPGTWVQLAPKVWAAPAGFQPADPTATASTTLVMMGLGSTCAYTPTGSGKVLVTVTCIVNSLTAASNVNIGGRYGTGTAPSNGAAVTGTRFGWAADPEIGSALSPVSRSVAATGLLSLTPATAYWFDLAISTTNASDSAQVQNVSMTLAEQP